MTTSSKGAVISLTAWLTDQSGKVIALLQGRSRNNPLSLERWCKSLMDTLPSIYLGTNRPQMGKPFYHGGENKMKLAGLAMDCQNCSSWWLNTVNQLLTAWVSEVPVALQEQWSQNNRYCKIISLTQSVSYNSYRAWKEIKIPL